MKKYINSQILKNAAKMLDGLSHPNRLRIIYALSKGRRSVNALSYELSIVQAEVSKHLAKLRNLGLVDRQVIANERHYFITEPKVFNILECISKHGGSK